MSALDFFESIPALQRHVDALRSQIETAYTIATPHGQRFGTVGGGGGDQLAGIDSIVDSNAAMRLETAEGMLLRRMDLATDVLYGRSGRGGLAKAACTDDADLLCFHYLQGESWASIARRYGADDANLTTWCRRRAVHVCRTIDRIGMRALADS